MKGFLIKNVNTPLQFMLLNISQHHKGGNCHSVQAVELTPTTHPTWHCIKLSFLQWIFNPFYQVGNSFKCTPKYLSVLSSNPTHL